MKAVTNYLKLSVRAPRDLSDRESFRRPKRRKPSTPTEYLAEWVWTFDGSSRDAMLAYSEARRKRTQTLKRLEGVPAEITISIYRKCRTLGDTFSVIGQLEPSHLALVS